MVFLVPLFAGLLGVMLSRTPFPVDVWGFDDFLSLPLWAASFLTDSLMSSRYVFISFSVKGFLLFLFLSEEVVFSISCLNASGSMFHSFVSFAFFGSVFLDPFLWSFGGFLRLSSPSLSGLSFPSFGFILVPESATRFKTLCFLSIFKFSVVGCSLTWSWLRGRLSTVLFWIRFGGIPGPGDLIFMSLSLRDFVFCVLQFFFVLRLF